MCSRRIPGGSAGRGGRAEHPGRPGRQGGSSSATGASNGEIQLRLSKTDWSDYDESDDCSRTTATSYADAP
ncbi:hypothetical protein ABZY10_09755 [Streptomyces sp. NPDC006539]|uniref:hypothetical protein n=1 Tax=unclassified Streptomyces TaxID=2593676 RepID=UPI0033A85D8A